MALFKWCGFCGVIGSYGLVYLHDKLDVLAELGMYKRNEVVVLVSGKRYSGKDYVCTRIERRLEAHSVNHKRFNHADQMKRIYCNSTGADLDLMLKDRSYKEKHRNAMTKLYERITSNLENKFMFCESIYDQITSRITPYNVIIIGDVRRKYEIEFYYKHFDPKKVITIRINASNHSRMDRGWTFDQAKDLNVTERDLDHKTDWNFVVENNETESSIIQWIDDLVIPFILRAQRTYI
eukprot:500217_1